MFRKDFRLHFVNLYFDICSCRTRATSNGNDIEMKRNDASKIGVFSLPKRNEPTYSKTWKDRSEAATIIDILCRIEEITNIISPKFAGSKRKRI
jgi:hypothetical protein